MKRAVPTERIRVAFGVALLGALAGERDAVLASVSAPTLRLFESSLGVGWVDMATHMELSDAIRAHVGPARNVELWRAAFVRVSERPVLRGFFATARRLFGHDAGGVVRHSPRIHEHMTEGIGALEVEMDHEPSVASVRLIGFPSQRYALPCYAEGLQGSVLAVLDAAGARASVTIEALDETRGRVEYRVTW